MAENRGILRRRKYSIWYHTLYDTIMMDIYHYTFVQTENVQHQEWIIKQTMDLGWLWQWGKVDSPTVTNTPHWGATLIMGAAVYIWGKGPTGKFRNFLSIPLWTRNCFKGLKIFFFFCYISLKALSVVFIHSWGPSNLVYISKIEIFISNSFPSFFFNFFLLFLIPSQVITSFLSFPIMIYVVFSCLIWFS